MSEDTDLQELIQKHSAQDQPNDRIPSKDTPDIEVIDGKPSTIFDADG